MSTVYIKTHDETIYDAVKQDIQRKEKKARYISKYKKKVDADYEKVKDGHKTFGYAEVPLKAPSQFLKKSACASAPTVICKCIKPGEHRCFKQKRLPPVPCHKATDKKAPDKRPATVNFVRKNIVSAKRSAPPQRCKRVVYTRYGDTQRVLPEYVYKKTYGQTPKYLLRKITQMELVHQEECALDADVRPLIRIMTEEEQASLLQGLKKNWEELQRTFQLLPLQTDTVTKKRRKAKLEDGLKQLEHNIRTVERHPYIYIYDDEL